MYSKSSFITKLKLMGWGGWGVFFSHRILELIEISVMIMMMADDGSSRQRNRKTQRRRHTTRNCWCYNSYKGNVSMKIFEWLNDQICSCVLVSN